MKQLNEIIRDLREDHDLKQSDIAGILGTSQQYYSKYEAGKFELPVRFLIKLADFYGVSADYLLGRTECPHGTDDRNALITPGYPADKLVADVMSLLPDAREDVRKYIALQRKAAQKQNDRR